MFCALAFRLDHDSQEDRGYGIEGESPTLSMKTSHIQINNLSMMAAETGQRQHPENNIFTPFTMTPQKKQSKRLDKVL